MLIRRCNANDRKENGNDLLKLSNNSDDVGVCVGVRWKKRKKTSGTLQIVSLKGWITNWGLFWVCMGTQVHTCGELCDVAMSQVPLISEPLP